MVSPEKKIIQSRKSPSCTYAVTPMFPGQLLSVQTGSSPPPSAASAGSTSPTRQISSVASKLSRCDNAGTNLTLVLRHTPGSAFESDASDPSRDDADDESMSRRRFERRRSCAPRNPRLPSPVAPTQTSSSVLPPARLPPSWLPPSPAPREHSSCETHGLNELIPSSPPRSAVAFARKFHANRWTSDLPSGFW